MRAWSEAKGGIADALGIEQDLLHLPVGLGLFLAFAWIFRRTGYGTILGLIGVTVLQVGNELLDAIQWWGWTETVAWGEALRDTGWTIVLPCLITVIDRMLKFRARFGA